VKSGAKLFGYTAVGTVASGPAIVNGRVFFGSGMSFLFGHPDNKFHVLATADAP
jgi:hypothetical protein